MCKTRIYVNIEHCQNEIIKKFLTKKKKKKVSFAPKYDKSKNELFTHTVYLSSQLFVFSYDAVATYV